MNESFLEIPGVEILEAKKFEDTRGSFQMAFEEAKFAQHLLPTKVVTTGISISDAYVFKGMHLQVPCDRQPINAQGKLVFLVSGKVYDVILDARKSSPTYKQWRGNLWDSCENKQLYVPYGVAHGFLSLQQNSTILYTFFGDYKYEWEKSIMWSDATLGITLPTIPMIISEKDSRGMLLRDVDVGM